MLSKKISRSYKQEDGDKKTFAKNSYVFLFSTRVSLSREASFLMKLTESVCRNRKKKKQETRVKRMLTPANCFTEQNFCVGQQ